MRKGMQRRLGPVSLSLLMAGSVLAGLGCGGEDLQAPTAGTLEITTATTGPEPDTDGYVIRSMTDPRRLSEQTRHFSSTMSSQVIIPSS